MRKAQFRISIRTALMIVFVTAAALGTWRKVASQRLAILRHQRDQALADWRHVKSQYHRAGAIMAHEEVAAREQYFRQRSHYETAVAQSWWPGR